MKEKVTAVVPIRKGSTRVPNKNLRKFGNTTLLELKINTLKKVALIDEIIVNTDSEKAIEIAKKLHVSFHRREAYFASSQCTNSEFLNHLGETTDTVYFAYCPVTSPFIKPQTISNCIASFFQSDADSLATVSLIKEFMWKDGQPLNYLLDKQPNSQNLPDIFALNFGLNIIRKSDLLKFKNIVGKSPVFKVLDEIEGLDIDTPLDFFTAEQYYIRTFINKKPLT